MKKTSFNHLDLTLYEEKLDNGLRVFVVPKNNVSGIYATFSTRYGSNTNEFIPIGEDKMIKVPDGVAHFLEHKVFEQKDGVDPFTFFGERGIDANANTNYKKTTYLISGIDNFKESLEFLLDYVQEPYFTDENVEKEKGIIEQELKMYEDSPYRVLYDGIMYNTFIEDPSKISIGGTVESIYKITKEDLYKCYNTFYHPSNMFIVITGNVEPDKIINIIKDNQSKKQFRKTQNITIKKYKEPQKVKKEYDEIKMDITIPKVMIAYKIDLNGFKIKDIRKVRNYVSILFDLKFGDTSVANEKLVEEKIVNDGIGIDSVFTEDYMIVTISGETDKPEEFTREINKELNNLNVTNEELERKKKVYIGNIVALSNNIYSLNNKIMANIIKYDKVIYDDYEYIKEFNIDELKRVIKDINLKNKTICVVKS